MPPACHAIATTAADDVAFARYEFAGMKIVDVGSDPNDLADELSPVTNRDLYRPLSPIVPIVDMNVGPAYAGSQHANQDIIDSDRRLGHVLQPQTAFACDLTSAFNAISSRRFPQWRDDETRAAFLQRNAVIPSLQSAPAVRRVSTGTWDSSVSHRDRYRSSQ